MQPTVDDVQDGEQLKNGENDNEEEQADEDGSENTDATWFDDWTAR